MIFSRSKIKQPTVFIGLSGGVDSSVAALRLKQRGFNVVGVFIKVWQPDFLKCDSERDRLDAMRVAAHLNIPFLTLDAAEEYKREVGEYFIREYQEGRTPNPDVMCNRHVKFGAFWRFAKEHGADFIATGHYARVEKVNDVYKLYRGIDKSKDQSYFLWTLTQEDLSHVLLPLGDTEKSVVREEARKAGLPTARKSDSQGICFLGHVDIPEFLAHFYEIKPGDVLDTNGKVIGRHGGAITYTLGQRHGFTIEAEGESSLPRYVIGKDIEKNVIVVGTDLPKAKATETIGLTNESWVSKRPAGEISAQFRYRQTPFLVSLSESSLELAEEVDEPASGQSAVFYQGDECLGGAVIAR